ncbi:MAG: hypothetical protein IPO81_18985 [Kouleothrix sp.]|nr:hypothetical protein [Kouleothrix sp.]
MLYKGTWRAAQHERPERELWWGGGQKIVARSLAVSLACSIIFFTSAARSAVASSLICPVQQQVECRVQPAGGKTGRTLVLIDGIASHYDSIDAMKRNWSKLTEKVAPIYSNFLYFSYNESDPERYTQVDTFKSLFGHHTNLLRDVLKQCHAEGHESFDLVGYSLGGSVACEYISLYGINVHRGWVQHVITLDSPVNGVNFADTAFWGVWFQNRVTSEAARELAAMTYSDLTRDQNILIAQRLEKLGTEMWTLANDDDLAFPPRSTVIPVLSRTFKLGNISFSLDIGTQVGHSQILDIKKFPQVGDTIYGILYHIPNSALVTELKEIPVLKPGEKGTARIVIQNASIMPWPADKTTLQHVRGPTFGRNLVRPLPMVPASGQLELTLSVQAPPLPGVYDSALKVAINDIPFGYEIPLSVVVVPAGSSAGLTEQIQALIAQAREDLSKRFQETWEGLREQILAVIREEIARQIRALISQICGVTPTGVVIAGGLVWWRRRRKREECV